MHHRERHERLVAQVYQPQHANITYKLLRGQIIVFSVLLLAWAFWPEGVEFAKRVIHLLPW